LTYTTPDAIRRHALTATHRQGLDELALAQSVPHMGTFIVAANAVIVASLTYANPAIRELNGKTFTYERERE
jgi:hypothetical protein